MEVSGKRINLPSKPCEICQIHNADGFCRECTEYMCKECFDHHVKGKPCRNHALCSVDQGSIILATKPFDKKCDIHINENVKYYCQKHEDVGCGDCMISNHDGCRPKLITNLATNFEESDEFNEMVRKIKELDADSNENMQRVQYHLKENKCMLDKALVEIRKNRKDINDYLDHTEKTVIAEAKKYSKENESLLSELKAKIATVSNEVDEIRNKLDTNKHRGVDLFIRMIDCMPRVNKVEQTVAEIKLNNTLKAYIFEPEQNLRDLHTSYFAFGSMKLTEYTQSNQEKVEEGQDELQARSTSTDYPKKRIKTKRIFNERKLLTFPCWTVLNRLFAKNSKNTCLQVNDI